MMKRKVLLVLGWLSVLDIVLFVVPAVLSLWHVYEMEPHWISVQVTVVAAIIALGYVPPPNSLALVATMAVCVFVALLVPLALFKLAARERRKAARPSA